MIPPNDWPIRKCLVLSLVIILTLLALIGISAIGFDIPGLRQIAGFLFLTLVPGILILRILKVHNIGLIGSMVYTVGLSLAFVMFGGALINFVLPLLSFSRPISLNSLTVSLTISTIILMVFAYVRDKNFRSPSPIARSRIDWAQLTPVLFLILLLLLTILAVVLIDVYQSNVLLLICLIAIAAVIALASFDKFIKQSIFPLAIFVIGLCLLYQTSLLSPYPVGSDIYSEYHIYQLVAGAGSWDYSIYSTINSCLSITMLAPIYSLILNIDGIWMFKAVYPLLFALVPLILYCIFSQQMSPKKAFLATFFFLAVPTYSLEMPSLCRQQIAELFVVLVIWLLIDRKMNRGPKFALVIIFSISIVVAHYALGILGLIYVGLGLPLVFLIRSDIFRRAWNRLTRRFGGLSQSLTASGAFSTKILLILMAIYFAFSIFWYVIIASGANLDQLRMLWDHQVKIITSGISSLLSISGEPDAIFQLGRSTPLVQTALGLDFTRVSIQGKVFRIFQYITELFIIAGFLRLIFKPKGLRFAAEYLAWSVISAILLLVSIFVPYFADPLNITRLYHITLLTLAPFCILGGEGIWLGISSVWRKTMRPLVHFKVDNEDNKAALRFIALAVLIPYFLLTSGFVYEVTKQEVTNKADTPYSIALSSYRLDLTGIFNLKDGAAASWLSQNTSNKVNVYADSHGRKILQFYEFPGKLNQLPLDASEFLSNRYVYLSTWNTTSRELTFTVATGVRRHVSFNSIPGIVGVIDSKSKVYDDGGAQIFSP